MVVKSETPVENGPFVSNIVFANILVALEKLVEMEISCPCKAKWNAWFAAAFFIIPGCLPFLMKFTCKQKKKKVQLHWVITSLHFQSPNSFLLLDIPLSVPLHWKAKCMTTGEIKTFLFSARFRLLHLVRGL